MTNTTIKYKIFGKPFSIEDFADKVKKKIQASAQISISEELPYMSMTRSKKLHPDANILGENYSTKTYWPYHCIVNSEKTTYSEHVVDVMLYGNLFTSVSEKTRATAFTLEKAVSWQKYLAKEGIVTKLIGADHVEMDAARIVKASKEFKMQADLLG